MDKVSERSLEFRLFIFPTIERNTPPSRCLLPVFPLNSPQIFVNGGGNYKTLSATEQFQLFTFNSKQI